MVLCYRENEYWVDFQLNINLLVPTDLMTVIFHDPKTLYKGVHKGSENLLSSKNIMCTESMLCFPLARRYILKRLDSPL